MPTGEPLHQQAKTGCIIAGIDDQMENKSVPFSVRTMSDRIYPDQVDCVWLASDQSGRVGAFITGGAGPIPVEVLDRQAPGLEDIERMVVDLPKTSEARLLVSVPRPDDFVQMAERGFFVYDWTDVHRTSRDLFGSYEPVAVPIVPIVLSALPEPLRDASVNLNQLTFAQGTLLDIEAHLQCRKSGD